MTSVWIDHLPLWLLLLLTVATIMASAEIGRYLAICQRQRNAKSADGPIGTVIGSTLGLLAFLLAFTFGIAANRFDVRRQLLTEEVNAIGTCYLRAAMLPDEQRIAVRGLLRDYVHDRAELSRRPEQLLTELPSFLQRADTQLDALWDQAVEVSRIDRNSEIYSLFVASLNDVIDLHTKRVVVGHYRIPGSIWLALYLVSIVSLVAVGYHFGLDSSRDVVVNLILAFTFSLVIVLIADLDNPAVGNLRVNQEPILELDAKYQADKD
ncbi:MAG: DUF4239 domain-containing protein [Planctomycetes bacterium]|nr:DUF4239 domain-containing protein [Planctomycetota bacterium]